MNQDHWNILVKTVGIDAIQSKASADGAEQKDGVVIRAQLEMDVMGYLVEIMNFNVY